MSRSSTKTAAALIRETGARVTGPRVRALASLLSQRTSSTHREIEERLGPDELIDRVTLYRVLDWLVAQGLAHKIAGNDQVWRFKAGRDDLSHAHAHFQCTDCSAVICMDNITIPGGFSLPRGFRLKRTEFLMKGLCPTCS